MTRDDLKKLNIPDRPGVYMFWGPRRNPIRTSGRGRPTSNGARILYIGKAASLHDRVRSYFSSDIATTRSSAIAAMAEEARTLTWEVCGSVLEALILEANLIKRHQPPYNVRDKDNKSFNYLVITKEDYPRVLVVRGRELFQNRAPVKNTDLRSPYFLKVVFGPFPQGGSLAEALKIVRKIFPYRDKCIPPPAGRSGKPCFNAQIGLCPGVCSGEMGKTEYARTIRNITKLFSGNMQGLKGQLRREMRAASKAERFEEATRLRRRVSALEHIRDVSLIKDGAMISAGGPVNVRIEAYDVAHTSGDETVGVMAVVQNGEPAKDAYRKFKIKSAKNDDVAALKEMLARRLAHTEWSLPRVLAVDGGLGQVRVALRVLKDAGVVIPVVGVVKNEFHKPERLIGDQKSIQAYEKDILLANSEAHRFAISWHRKRRGHSMFDTISSASNRTWICSYGIR